MGTSGSPWIVEKSAIIKAIKVNKGKVTHAADYLDVSYKTLNLRIKEDPELIQLVQDERNTAKYNLVYSAEETISDAMKNRSADMTNALKGAFFVLNSIGDIEGYKNTQKQEQTITFIERDPTDRSSA